MTDATDEMRSAEASTSRSIGRGAEHFGVAAVLAFWAVPFARAFGGRGVHTELVFAVVLGCALLLHRDMPVTVPLRSALLPSLIAIAALLVCVWAPTGWSGSDVAAGYGISAVAYVVLRRYARSTDRQVFLVSAVCLADIYQFSQAFTPWWGGNNPADQMTGTFYGHNAYAAFLLPGAILGLGLIADVRRPWAIAGWVSVPLCVAGIVISSSRATFAVLVVGCVLMLAASLRSRRSASRVLGALALAGAVTFALPGPPLFAHHVSPFAATETRVAAGESLDQNGHYRVEFWRSAGEVFRHHPAVGAGFHSLAPASALYTPSSWARSPNAHNGYLQVLSDGGLLLGIPFLLAIAIAAGWALRRLWGLIARRSRQHPVDLVVVSVAVALLGMLAHSAVDADWTYPAIMLELAVLVACVAPVDDSAREAQAHGSPTLTTAAAAISITALLGVLGTELFALHQWQVSGSSMDRSTTKSLADSGAIFGDYRPADRLMRLVVEGEMPITTAQAARILELTRDEAKIDVHLALRRDALGARFGLIPDAVEQAQSMLRRISGGIGPYVVDLATIQAAAGDSVGLRATLVDDLESQKRLGKASPIAAEELELWAKALGTDGGYACEVAAISDLVAAPRADAYPAPSAPCRAS